MTQGAVGTAVTLAFLMAGQVVTVGCSSRLSSPADPAVVLERVPRGGVQPQAAASADGVVHLVYLTGDAAASDVHYARRSRSGDWSSPVRVNSEAGSATAMGTVRGAHLALGRDRRVHVTWNGAARGDETPFFYARSANDGRTFEPQRNLVTWASGLDGGGSVAADSEGRVYAAWHATAGTRGGETARLVVLATSEDDGAHFAREEVISVDGSGACACCGLRARAAKGRLWVLYRAARAGVERDMVLVSSDARGPFDARTLEPWKSDRCPMSTASVIAADDGIAAAWESGDRVRFQLLPAAMNTEPGAIVEPPRIAGSQKHPVLARNESGEMLMAWTEGTGWNRGGSVAWQRYDRDGRPLGPPGHADGVPAWGLAATAPLPDGRFLIVY